VKPGYLTTEFWATVALAGSAVATDLGAGTAVSGDVKDVITAAGALVVGVYTLARSGLKRKAMVPTAAVPVPVPVPPPPPAGMVDTSAAAGVAGQ
jgi:hypothetical protein